MPKFEANLQFMYNEYDLIDRYEQASKSGFEGVELQAPYSLEVDQIREKLDLYKLKHVIINLPVQDPDTNLANIALRPDRKDLFLERLELGINYASNLGCIGINTGIGTKPENFDDDEIYNVLVENQRIASEKLSEKNIKTLIEPINTVDQPGFFINTSKQGIDLIEELTMKMHIFFMMFITCKLWKVIYLEKLLHYRIRSVIFKLQIIQEEMNLEQEK